MPHSEGNASGVFGGAGWSRRNGRWGGGVGVVDRNDAAAVDVVLLRVEGLEHGGPMTLSADEVHVVPAGRGGGLGRLGCVSGVRPQFCVCVCVCVSVCVSVREQMSTHGVCARVYVNVWDREGVPDFIRVSISVATSSGRPRSRSSITPASKVEILQGGSFERNRIGFGEGANHTHQILTITTKIPWETIKISAE